MPARPGPLPSSSTEAARQENGGAAPQLLPLFFFVFSFFLSLDLRGDELDQHRSGRPDARREALRRVVGDRQGAASAFVGGGGGGGGGGGESSRERVEKGACGAVVGRERGDVVDDADVFSFLGIVARAVSSSVR